ncbi:MAG: hypothetical protein EOO80_00760 [Oxalobacteraceae bacterium]|nr:MAG: hypothetical protein EOO80_00760 [Oxalobacteraceae bacterium]
MKTAVMRHQLVAVCFVYGGLPMSAIGAEAAASPQAAPASVETRPDVGSYPPNPAGLYGMSENTYEWVADWFDENYYKNSPENNPTGPAKGVEKVKRGSVGGKAEISAMLFMRTKAVTQPMETTYPHGPDYDKRVMLPFPGYSSHPTTNFRCMVNSLRKKIK